ncbi:adenosine/AMP deaminase [Gluconacetobacter diazotrophicus PA1 5]|uniref:adenosine deaminase family protein n=1 Tax=Gluconacetobacter diazotrophicus TaxID=33996 RepID=UPI000173D03E|nr:adenosine deaminase [Gluconacetobacter diazotrophicus]ACI51016.1 adenosine/AMP deaminase [Gluconacetobacter diazotrophicus PA1 5]TWB08529.1 adenosine deaminase [Gluconacetobacter diazotrophicus]
MVRLVPVCALAAGLAVSLITPGVAASRAAPAPPDAVSAAFDRIRTDPARLDDVLRAMPKGADLHNHLAGAVYAESMLDWAAQDGLCVSPALGRILPGNCGPAPVSGRVRAADLAARPDDRADMIDALSMRDFVPTATDRSGHDHFFATFDRFMPVQMTHGGDMLAEAVTHAAGDHVLYLELMVSPQLGPVAGLGTHLPLQGDGFADVDRAIAPALPALVVAARQEVDAMEARMHAVLQCGTDQARPGCSVVVRYLYQTIRTMPPAMVFPQLDFGYALVKADPRFVGVNIVAPEDNAIAMRDYGLHMRMFGWLARRDPQVKLSLHAGELAPGLVPPEGLRTHIRQAVEIAGARRIGHGVDILHEDDSDGLMAEMARRRVMVEINLTSNDVILGVAGAAHPFRAYRAAGVPVALSTDDEGVSRIDLTREYDRAATTYALDYAALRDLSRSGLEYAFVPGDSLWRQTAPYRMVAACAAVPPGPAPAAGACHDVLAGSEKARLQWTLEARLHDFEAGMIRDAGAGAAPRRQKGNG